MEKEYKKKNKPKKKWLISILMGVVLLIIAVGGYFLYEFKFKTYDIADEKVDEIIQDNYVIELPDGTEISVDQDGNIIKDESGQLEVNGEEKSTSAKSTSGEINESQNQLESSDIETSNGTTTEIANGRTTGTENQAASETTKTTVKAIKQKYQPSLEALQSQASSRVNSLIANAKSEYAQKKENGESISVGYFYNKYIRASESIEASTDAAFNRIMAIMEEDLVSNGFDKSHAKSFRGEYEASKEALRSNLMSQVKSAL